MASATTRAATAKTTDTHSIRAPKETWAKAEARAKRQGLNRNRLVVELLEGYSLGIYKLPKLVTEVTRTYADPVTATAPIDVVTESSGTAA